MLFECLAVQNLGAFRGKHSIDLMPPDSRRPIVLVGALNGSGKTTVIEALQLALYGKRASYGWRGAQSYLQYLEQVRNRHADRLQPTIAEVSLRLADGRRLRVERQWSFTKDTPREYISVFADGAEAPDLRLSECWDEEIERLLPARLAELFFFDGERIEQLAAPVKSAEVLRSAVSSLLGLDLVDHLVADLEIMRSRQKQRFLTEAEQARLEAIQSEQQEISEKVTQVHLSRATCQTRRDGAEGALVRLETRLRQRGGDRFQQRQELIVEREGVGERLKIIERQLRECVAGVLPLRIIHKKLLSLVDHANERAKLPGPEAVNLLEKSLQRMVMHAEKLPISGVAAKSLREYARNEVRVLRNSSSADEGIDWREISKRLSDLLETRLKAAATLASNLAQTVREITEKIHNLDEQIAHLPDGDQLADLYREQGAAKATVVEIDKELAFLAADEKALDQKLHALQRERSHLLDKSLDATDASRLADYCQRSVLTLAEFRSNLVRMRREQLERLILEAFQLLTRKEDLIGQISLDPDTMAISLKSVDGKELVTQQLSAGERQLLAVAMLWGLAKATGRPVPVVIDTPLGRLDGAHRKTIVERYFPDAGHQVILLSTDTEVDATFSALLDDSVAHRYLIGYDSKARSSSFVPGYFRG